MTLRRVLRNLSLLDKFRRNQVRRRDEIKFEPEPEPNLDRELAPTPAEAADALRHLGQALATTQGHVAVVAEQRRLALKFQASRSEIQALDNNLRDLEDRLAFVQTQIEFWEAEHTRLESLRLQHDPRH